MYSTTFSVNSIGQIDCGTFTHFYLLGFLKRFNEELIPKLK